ncbi:MAG: hypothetical protein V9G04_10195 [Nocardioides sp.]
MSTTTTRKPSTRKSANEATKPTAPKEQKAAPVKAETNPKAKAKAKPEPKNLIEALTTGQASLIKVRANKTTRSLPYLAVGSEERKKAESVIELREAGSTVDSLAESMNVSVATVRRFITNLALAHAVEAGEHNAAWTKGNKEVIVRVVKPAKA